MSVIIGTNVQKVLRNTRPVFEEGVKRVKKNAEKVDDETLDEWKSAFCQLSREYAILENRIKVSKQVIANQLGVRSSNTENQEKDKDFEKRIKREIEEKISSFDPISDEFCKGVEKKLGKSTVVDNDDIEEVEIEVTESTYKCPYSQLKFDRPMKSANCKHHISQVGLNELLKNKQSCRCPIAGCSKQWTKNTSSYDEEFDKAMTRFFQRSQNTSNSASQKHTVNIDDDADDGYTQI